jgi:hypothetical protein
MRIPSIREDAAYLIRHAQDAAMVRRSVILLLTCAMLAGCGVVAAPCRIASAGLKIVPLVGHVAAAPTDACADVIDP